MRPLAFLILVQVVGCAGLPTDAQREASFEPYHALTVAGQPMAAFVMERTAILVVSDSIEPDDTAAEGGFRYALPPNKRTSNLEQSLAVAIDRRGYFMTAYHCVEKGRKPIIVYRENAILFLGRHPSNLNLRSGALKNECP